MHKLIHWWVLPLALFYLASCNTASKQQQIVDEAIEKHGGEKFEDAYIAFDFRDRHYTYNRQGDNFIYTREFTDSTGQVRDVLRNAGFYRSVDGNTASLTEERKNAFSNSVNSVIYFSLLPYRLNDPAVNKEYIRQTEIDGKPYHLIKVTFDQEGGGEDFDDEFLYWFNTESGTLDYLAYSYHTDGGGLRFRKAVNPREIGGIRFQDYINYKPTTKEVKLEELEDLYKKGALEVLSEIKLENIEVKAPVADAE